MPAGRRTVAGDQPGFFEDGYMLRAFGSLAMIALVLFCSSGCAGLGETPGERNHRWSAVANNDVYGLVEDVDAVLQTDRPSRLTKWKSK
ncbi:MAG: hypothetical protein C4547_15425 [Phycisphaerales bacterium]|nr:MAG: hypothetical protein C4547_15425 [Phycisphaerales bacterium]